MNCSKHGVIYDRKLYREGTFFWQKSINKCTVCPAHFTGIVLKSFHDTYFSVNFTRKAKRGWDSNIRRRGGEDSPYS